MEQETVLYVENLNKKYRTGTIGSGSLRRDLQSYWAKLKGKEDPNKKIFSKRQVIDGEFYALKDINLEIKKGERVGIIGWNGAGKSTLLKIISRITAPTEGTIKIKGKIASMLEVGTGFHAELTGRENIYLNGAILGMTRAEVDEKIEDIIEFSECRMFIDTPVKRYSSGMYVKLAFAVAAHLDADILIMDEVLAVGDVAFQEKCLGKMDDVSTNEGKTVLYVSHNMATVQRLCDRCIVLEEGQIIFDGETDKAIDIYLDSNKDNDICRDYYDDRLSGRKKLYKKKILRIEHAEYYEHSSIKFQNENIMKIAIRWKCYEDIENLCFRYEIWSLEGVPVATSMIFDIGAYKAGDTYEKIFTVDISSFVPGRYAGYYSMFRKSEYGSCDDLDRVESLLFYKSESDSDIIWNNRRWGRVRLEDATVEESCEIVK